MKVATLDIGYGDGYETWALAIQDFHERRDAIPYVMIGNHKAEVIGKISMNMITVDVTLIPERIYQ